MARDSELASDSMDMDFGPHLECTFKDSGHDSDSLARDSGLDSDSTDRGYGLI